VKRVSRRLYLLWSLAAVLLLAIGACSPFGGDGDDDDAPASPTATREIIMMTFTPTEVVPPEQLTSTAIARETAVPATQTARANLPTPTPANPTVAPEELLTPPQARLETPEGLVDSQLSSYAWQFDDEAETFARIDAPIVQFVGEPAPVASGDELTLQLYGEAYRTPPLELEIEVYNFDENSAIPSSGQQVGDELAFAIKTDPDQRVTAGNPATPSFVIDVPPGHYAIRAQGRWGPNPNPMFASFQLFVTWVFNVEVT
jgi:hypothetical protein